jgi:hypothetical protein
MIEQTLKAQMVTSKIEMHKAMNIAINHEIQIINGSK